MARNRRKRALMTAAGMLMLVAQSAFAAAPCPCGAKEVTGGCHDSAPVERPCHEEAPRKSCCTERAEAASGCPVAVEASCCAMGDVPSAGPAVVDAVGPEVLVGPVAPAALPAAAHVAGKPVPVHASRAPAPPGAPAWLRHGALLN